MSDAKKRKVDRENRKFNDEWTTKYFFTTRKDKAACLICQEEVANFKEHNIRRHFISKHANYGSNLSDEARVQKASDLLKQLKKQQNIFTKQNKTQEAVTKASFLVAFDIAKESKAFCDSEFIKRCIIHVAEVVCPEKVKDFEKLSLSRRTIVRRVEDINQDLLKQLILKSEKFDYFSIALDDSTDIADTAQLLIFIRGINSDFEISQELLSMESMKDTTTGEDLLLKVKECIEKRGLSWTKLKSVTTDGSPNLTGKNVGLLSRLKKIVHEICPDHELAFLHCIIHQEALCKNILNMNHVVNVVVKIVNFIRARGLNHRQFIAFMEEIEADYNDIPYHCNIRWLSLARVIKRLWELKEEIKLFLKMKQKDDQFPQFYDPQWLADLAFLVDIMDHLNKLNLTLIRRDAIIHELYFAVNAFEKKLTLFSNQMKERKLQHFPTLNSLTISVIEAEKYTKKLSDLQSEFSRRFTDFKKIQLELMILSNPFTVNVEHVPSNLQLELIELQSTNVLKDSFKPENVILFFKSLSNDLYPNLKDFAKSMLVMFASTYICEQTFSIMKHNKSDLRSQMTDEHLAAVLRIATTNMQPNFDKLVYDFKQLHFSH